MLGRSVLGRGQGQSTRAMGEAGQTLLWPASMALNAVVPQRSAAKHDTGKRAETAWKPPARSTHHGPPSLYACQILKQKRAV